MLSGDVNQQEQSFAHEPSRSAFCTIVHEVNGFRAQAQKMHHGGRSSSKNSRNRSGLQQPFFLDQT